MSEPATPDTDSAQQLTIERGDGTRFAVTHARAADAGAPSVLVVPAMGMAAGYYRKLVVALADQGISGAVMELRGHEACGGRRPGRRYDFGYADLVEDVGAALDAVADVAPDSPLLLLGHSLGGHLSAVYAATHPDRIAGLVLVASGTIHWRHWSLRHLMLTQGISALAQVVGHHPGKLLGFAGRESRGVIADWARLARTGRLRFGSPKVDHDRALQRLSLPALSISLAGDTLAPRHTADALVAMMPALDLTRVHLEPSDPAVDHFRWARLPESVLPTITAWRDGVRTN